MTNHTIAPSPQTYARAAGWLYLSVILFGIFSLVNIPLLLVTGDSPLATVSNVLASESMARFSIASGLITQIINIVLALVLYKLLEPASKAHASLMVILFLVSAPITMLNHLNQYAVLILLDHSDYLASFTPEQLQALMHFFLELYEYGLQITSIFWGLWLFPMGYAIFKSGFIPKLIGILLMVACFGYLFDSFAGLLFPSFGVRIVQFTFIGEPAVTLWLLFKGVDVAQWQKLALKSA